MKLLITAGLLIGLLVFVSAPETDSPYSYNLLTPPTETANLSNSTVNNSEYLVGIPGNAYALDSDLNDYCQTNGTNCPVTPGGFVADQDLNTTSNVQFNATNIIPSANIGSSGYVYGHVGDYNITPSTTTFYNVFQSTGTSFIDTVGNMVPRLFYNARRYNIEGIGTATQSINYQNDPTFYFRNSQNVTLMQSMKLGAIYNADGGYTRITDVGSLEIKPQFNSVNGGTLEVPEYRGIYNNAFQAITGVTDYYFIDWSPQLASAIPNLKLIHMNPSVLFGYIDDLDYITIGSQEGRMNTQGIASSLNANAGNNVTFINGSGTAPSYFGGNVTFYDYICDDIDCYNITTLNATGGGGSSEPSPVYFTCGESAALDPGAEWSCGGNGETTQYIYIADNITLTDIALSCNVGTGTANVTVEDLSGDIGCFVESTASTRDASTCNTDVDEGSWIRPYTISDTGHSACVVTLRGQTR